MRSSLESHAAEESGSAELSYSESAPANPFLDIASRLWEEERYEAARICYGSMRSIDDMVDSLKSAGRPISEEDKAKATAVIRDLTDALVSGESGDSAHRRLIEVVERFRIPLRPWYRFARSMIYDLEHDGFRTFQSFLNYAEGAAVGPASIGMYLCGVAEVDGHYNPPAFDVREAASPLATFFYLVHIIRDFQEDQNNGLNCFADDLMAVNGLSPMRLREIAAGSEIGSGFRNMMRHYCSVAEHCRLKARRKVDELSDYLEPRYLLSLRVIYELYLLVYDRIDVINGGFTTAELTPSPGEVRTRVYQTIARFGLRMPFMVNGRRSQTQ